MFVTLCGLLELGCSTTRLITAQQQLHLLSPMVAEFAKLILVLLFLVSRLIFWTYKILGLEFLEKLFSRKLLVLI